MTRTLNYPQPDWRAQAECVGYPLEMFLPLRGETGAAAKRVCAECPVAEGCLATAIVDGAEARGIFGGTTQRERKVLRKHIDIVHDCIGGCGTRVTQQFRGRQGPQFLPICDPCRKIRRAKR